MEQLSICYEQRTCCRLLPEREHGEFRQVAMAVPTERIVATAVACSPQSISYTGTHTNTTAAERDRGHRLR